VIGVRTQAAIAPDGHVLYSVFGGISSYGPAQVENKFFIQVFVYNSSYVIFSKNIGIKQSQNSFNDLCFEFK
jgi:hypothetical protein